MGFFLVNPILYLPLGVVNLKLDDILLLFLIFFYLSKAKEIFLEKKIVLFAFFIIYLVLYGLFRRKYYPFEFDNYPLVRMVGVVLYMLMLMVYIKKENLYLSLIKGVFIGSNVIVVVMSFALLYHIYMYGVSGLYSLKDSLRVLGTFNPNSYGAMMLFSSFCSFALLKYNHEKKYKYFSILCLIIPFIFLIKRDMLGILFSFVYLYAATKKIKIRLFLYLCIFLFSIYGLNELISVWDNAEFIRLMAHRVEIYKAAFSLIMENGYGYGLGSEIEVIFERMGRPNVSHNSFLSFSLELGVFNTLIFLVALTYIFSYLKCVWIRAYFIMFFVESLLGNGFYFYKYHFLFLIFSLLYFKYRQKENC